MSENPELRYWKTPPNLAARLDAEFHFDFDPCPYPRPSGFDGTKVDWGQTNYVNPPFHRTEGIGPTAFARKAIAEQSKGKTSVLVLPVQSYVNLLLEAGAELRSLGRVRWVEVESGLAMPGPSPICCFILRGKTDQEQLRA
jgi:hypothetical protein